MTRFWAACAVLAWIGAALHGAAPSNANPLADCHTTYANSGRDTETYCVLLDVFGQPYRVYTYCYGNTGHCTTRNA